MASDCYCPACNHKYSAPWDLFEVDHDAHKDEEAQVKCLWCGRLYKIERIVTVEYRTKVESPS